VSSKNGQAWKFVAGRSFSEQLAARCLSMAPTAADYRKARVAILDYLSCALTGADLPWSRAATDIAAQSSGASQIVGHAINCSPADAAFANAVLGHSLVRDDMHLGSVSHLGTVIIPTLLALSSSSKATGKEFLTAMIAGYEAGGTLGRAVLDSDIASNFRPTGICGPIAAAAAGARLLELNQEQTTAAIGLAANTIAGYNEWAATGGSEMFFQVGFAARNALLALQLVARESNISRTAIDGPAGLFAAFDKPHVAADEAPTQHEIQEVFFKEVPACNFAQTPAQAALELTRENKLNGDTIDSVVVFVNHAAAHYPGCDSQGPFEHILQAKMSIQYNVAAALLKGNFDEANYEPETQKEICELASSIDLRVDHLLTAAYPKHQSARVRVDLEDGHRLSHEMADVRGADDMLVSRRFDAAADARLDNATARILRDRIAKLENADNCRLLSGLKLAAEN
jgi:2-methylcitrate dehydratase PrpD